MNKIVSILQEKQNIHTKTIPTFTVLWWRLNKKNIFKTEMVLKLLEFPLLNFSSKSTHQEQISADMNVFSRLFYSDKPYLFVIDNLCDICYSTSLLARDIMGQHFMVQNY